MEKLRLTTEETCNQIAALTVDLNLPHCTISDINRAVRDKIIEITGVNNVKVDLLKDEINISPCDCDIHLDYIEDTTEVVISIIKFETRLIWE